MEDESHTFIANDILVHNSSYVQFGEVVSSCDWKGDPKELILKINEYRLKDYLNVAFERYAQRHKVENCQDFELENISESGIWLAKKKYILDKVWEDKIDYDHLKNVSYKGIELAQAGTPIFAREKIMELLKFIFDKKEKTKLNDIIQMLKKYKAEFRMAEPEKLAKGTSISDYSSYILNDTTSFEIAKGTPEHVRAAGYYNFLLNKNSKYKQKYEMIRSGDKIKTYHVLTKGIAEQDVFAFLSGSFPVEFAPPINYDVQFGKIIIDPINRVTQAMGLPEIGHNLYISTSLF